MINRAEAGQQAKRHKGEGQEGRTKSKIWERRMTKTKKNERSGDEKNEQTKEWRLRAGGREDDGPSQEACPPLHSWRKDHILLAG